MSEQSQVHVLYDGCEIPDDIEGTSVRISRHQRQLEDVLIGQVRRWDVKIYNSDRQPFESAVHTDDELVQYLQDNPANNILLFLKDFPCIIRVLLQPKVSVTFTPSVTAVFNPRVLDEYLLDTILQRTLIRP